MEANMRVALTLALAMGTLALPAKPALGATTCDVTGTVMEITGDQNLTITRTNSGALTLNGQACDGASVATIDKVIVTMTTGDKVRIDLSNGPFTGATDETGDIDSPHVQSEIEFDVKLENGAIVLLGSEEADRFTASGYGLNYNGDNDMDVVVSNAWSAHLSTGGGDDVVTGAGSSPSEMKMSIEGGAGDDTLTGGNQSDTFEGGSGSDSFSGGAGRDLVTYWTQTGSLAASLDNQANDGAVLVKGQIGGEMDNIKSDVEDVWGGQGSNHLTGNDGPNHLAIPGGGTAIGGGGDDKLGGGKATDQLLGGAGNDELFGVGGADALDGGEGDDWLAGGRRDDDLVGGPGSDTASYSFDVPADVGVVAGIGSKRSGADFDDDGIADEADRIRSDIETLEGSPGDDRLSGNGEPNTLQGGRGDDILVGRGGDDDLYGDYQNFIGVSDGNDQLIGEAGADSFFGGGGRDTVSYRMTHLPVVASLSDAADAPADDGRDSDGDGVADEGDAIQLDVENIFGGAASDTLVGNSRRNKLWGWTGNDLIEGRGGRDVLAGQSERDRFKAADKYVDRVIGGDGKDRVLSQDSFDKLFSIP